MRAPGYDSRQGQDVASRIGEGRRPDRPASDGDFGTGATVFIAGDAQAVPACALVAGIGQGRGRRHAQTRNRHAGADHGVEARVARVAVQHQFRTVPPQHRTQRRAVDERLAPADRALGHRMMQHQHADPPGGALALQNLGQSRELRCAQAAARQKRRVRTRAVQADQGHLCADVDVRPAVRGARPGGPALQTFGGRHLYQRIVIAGNETNARGRRQRRQPDAGLLEFPGQRKIGHIASDHNVIQRMRLEVGDQCLDHGGRLESAPPPPRPDAQLTLGKPLSPRQTRLERQMQIRDMREYEGFHWIMLGRASGRADYAIPAPLLPRPSRMNLHDTLPSGARLVGDSSLRIWGLTSRERLARQLARAGAIRANRVLLLRADWVYHDALVRGLVAADDDQVLVADNGTAVAALVDRAHADTAAAALARGEAAPGQRPVAPAALAGDYNDALRKREPPFLMPLAEATLPEVERRIFGASYKGVTDFVTRHVWPAPARVATRWCAQTGLTPNQVTAASFGLVLAAMALFWHGHYGAGLVAAWLMTFLDTVDGKLARVTLQSTKWGNVFDHGIDLVHPPFWWWAWIVGLPAAGLPLDTAGLALAAIVAGYVLQRVEEGVFMAAFGMDMHVWRRFDSRFRLVTARRNPNLAILTAATLGDRPDLGILTVAVWTVLCLVVHAIRIAQAGWARRRGPLVSWLAH